MTALALAEPAGRRLLDDPAYSRLKECVIRRTGLAYYVDKDANLAGRLSRRLDALQIGDCASYLQLLETDPDERDRLAGELTIGETYFFRHTEMFRALRERVLPELIAQGQSRQRLNVWSAGCSIGAEPYSVAILLRRDLRHLTNGWDIHIVATDINPQYLAHAERGEYEQWAFRSVPQQVKDSCFIPTNGLWRIRPEFADPVTFQQHNLVEDAFPDVVRGRNAFDLILCRNVFIYFDKQLALQTIDKFYDRLSPHGWLCVGHSEPSIELFARYRTVRFDGAVLYQRPGGEERAALEEAKAEETRFVPKNRVEMAPPVSNLPRLCPPDPAADLDTAAEDGAADVFSRELDEILGLADQGKLEAALSRAARLLERENLNPRAHLCHALILWQLGLEEDSLAALRRSLFLDRRDALAHYCLGLLLGRRREWLGARRSFRNAARLAADRDPQELISQREELTAVRLLGLAPHTTASDEETGLQRTGLQRTGLSESGSHESGSHESRSKKETNP